VTIGHPDWDSNVIWRGKDLYAQSSGDYPAAGTVLWEGYYTGWPSLQVLINPSAGGMQLAIKSYTDSTMSIGVGDDTFDATSNTGQLFLYESRGAYLQLSISAVTTSPAGAGHLAVTPSRAAANEYRALVTPQSIILNAQSIGAGDTLNEYFRWVVLGQLQWIVTAVSPADSIKATLQYLTYAGAAEAIVFDDAVILGGANETYNALPFPLNLQLVNTTTAAATVTTTLISQQQGW